MKSIHAIKASAETNGGLFKIIAKPVDGNIDRLLSFYIYAILVFMTYHLSTFNS
jgi:hypothetical protein